MRNFNQTEIFLSKQRREASPTSSLFSAPSQPFLSRNSSPKIKINSNDLLTTRAIASNSYRINNYHNYQAIMKFSLSFLSPSIPPSSSVFTFRRQTKFRQPSCISKEWTGWTLSIDQICSGEMKEMEEGNRGGSSSLIGRLLGDEGNYLDPSVG